MPTEVKLPQFGESTFEGTIGKWLKQPGERVERFEPLVEIVTDKVNVEMPSPFSGVLKEILVPEGETKAVGTTIATMDVQGREEEAPAEAPGAAVAAVAKQPPTGGPAEPREHVRLSPLVKRLAEEHGVPLEEVERLEGSGAGGRVTKDDLLRYVEERKAARPLAPAAAPGTDQLIKVTPLRRTTAQRMAQSKREIPHAYGVIEVDMTDVVRWREAHKAEWAAVHGVNLTYTAFLVRTAAEALRAFPIANSTWTDEGVLLRGSVHIGIGVAIEEGLVVPVIKDADHKSLVGVARELADLGAKARDGKLELTDVHGATFTITNPGVFGSVWSMPIIVPGQAAILATDAIVKRPVARNDAIAIRSIMHLGLSFDHRIFDGAVAVQFLNHIKARLEGFQGGDRLVTDL